MWDTASIQSAKPLILGATILFSSAQTHSILPLEEFDFNSKYINHVGENLWTSYDYNKDSSYSLNSIEDKVDVADIVDLVKVTLGLPNKDIADVFKVTRQTLHNYKNQSESNHNLHEQNLTRVKKLKSIFDELSLVFEKSPGALSKTYIVNNHTLFDLLTADELDRNSIVNIAHQLKTKMEFKSKIHRNNDDISLLTMTNHG
ncbi:hypothetical protein ACT4YA_10280 [Acinetobacter baumannii]|uniref:hypothetical protein n=1 Tax=Acinetobacter sp. 1179249 TaxID=1310790 RepID=UPI000445A020|nr:hypothetical protein [Acinetobacter sp. 1179249]EXR29853.1 hypothetical protein J689_2926 [Acinetobacter sp. 1179249]